MIFEMMSRGQSLAVIIRDGRGEVMSLLPVPSGQWAVLQKDGMRELAYRITGISEDVYPDDVLHFRLEDPGGWWARGRSAFNQCNGSVQQLQEQETTAVSLSSDTRPGPLIPVELMTTECGFKITQAENEEFQLNGLSYYYELLGEL